MEHRQSSFIAKLPVIMATIEQRKAELSGKKLQLLEAKRLGATDVKELEIEWGTLESEIDLLEHTANVMRSDLTQRGLLVADGMNAGAGVTHDMVLVNENV
ncbi:hypothetical protein L1987_70832 [Smallanthus sonchifolius]|uniref:Uncharacterized protein n=1 Tax=Smallanthus sonchifolius TaxID=185202 RepID=A0ACB9AQQ0_9ASTR|nr:hypothetical protein L1987_70832 [Smallanthus sonchifolius]